MVTTYMDDLPWGSFDSGKKDILGKIVEKYDFKLSSIYPKWPGSNDGVNVTITYKKETLVVTNITISFPTSVAAAKTAREYNELYIYEYTRPIFYSNCELSKEDLQKFVYVSLFSRRGEYDNGVISNFDSISEVKTHRYYLKEHICGVSMSYDDVYVDSYSSDGHYMSGRHDLSLR